MTTPMMQQWHECKERAGSALLLFRLGDFYEAFYDDAKALSKELELTLTKRQDIPMAGIPHHALDNYLERLVAKGYVVALAEQVEDPKQTKGIVKRQIARIISPATYVSDHTASSNQYFASLTFVDATWGLALIDISTGEFSLFTIEREGDLIDELVKRAPKELLIAKATYEAHRTLFDTLSLRVEVKEDRDFAPKMGLDRLLRHFKTPSLEGFGLSGDEASIGAAAALLTHLGHTLSLDISHINRLRAVQLSHFMALDRRAADHLELTHLIKTLDQTGTPMGARLLKKWILHPLLDPEAISARQEAIGELMTHSPAEPLGRIRDLERLMMKIVTQTAGPRDLYALRLSLENVPPIKERLAHAHFPLLKKLVRSLIDTTPLVTLIKERLMSEPPARLSDGGVIRSGVDANLDELRRLKKDSQTYLANYQTEQREKLGIKTLKVGFNKAFGYFIEVSRAQAAKMPETFQKRQTLVNTERFISPELKEYEQKILTAEERISAIEGALFNELRRDVAKWGESVLLIAQSLAQIDSLTSLAQVAALRGYIRPTMTLEKGIAIKEGRHPIVEESLIHETFIPNDTDLGTPHNLMLITGPNMAGKSTYIRQVALLTIMAQIGAYIPAKEARIGIVDKVFTRIGASDDLMKGQSTFMVEMTETANILNNATDRSLVILDEIGRGTSTYDGISIAYSVAEHLLTVKKPITLFATHYFELTELETAFEGALNYNVAVEEQGGGVIFLRKIVKGASDQSYGIHVAQLAGLPSDVIEKAKLRLYMLETQSPTPPKELPLATPSKTDQTLKDLDTNNITPLQALQLLVQLKSDVR